MLENQMTMLILSCDNYSDLWDGHVHLLEKYWHDRSIKTIIVTDKSTEKTYDDISVFVAGENVEWSDRLKLALEQVTTEFVFVTLDDYFLTAPVSNEKIEALISIMKEDQYDYVRLYIHPQCPKSAKVECYSNFYTIDTSVRYSVNLFPGIWKKSFLEKTVAEPRNIWKYEVSLSKSATKENAKCAVSLNDEFQIMDVIRQGKIQRKAKKLLSQEDLYNGNREMHSVGSDLKYLIRVWASRSLPKWIREPVRNLAIKMGVHIFSAE